MLTPLPLRLPPGSDLRRALEAACINAQWPSAFVLAGIGSLSVARLRLADAQHEVELAGPLEILSLSGSVCPDGAHLHMAVADAQGRVRGGHVAYGNPVHTTAELLLACLPGWPLTRAWDEATGYRELQVPPGPQDSPAPPTGTPPG